MAIDADIFYEAKPTSAAGKHSKHEPPERRTAAARQERRFILAHWRDPFSHQGPAVDCAKWCQITPWDKWCCGHTYKWKYLDVDLVLTIGAPDNNDLGQILNECLQQGAIAGALAGILAAIATGGAALAVAIETFKGVLFTCLSSKLAGSILRLDQESQWTDWQ